MLWFRVPLYIMTIDDLEMLLATYKKDKSRFDDVVKALVENKRGGNDYKSVLEILNIYIRQLAICILLEKEIISIK